MRIGDGTEDRRYLTASALDSKAWRNIPIASVDDALVLLADQRFEPLWPALLAMTGPDLGHLRDLLLIDAKENFDQTMAAPDTAPTQGYAAMIANSKERAYAMYAQSLFDNGKTADADRILALGISALAADPANGDNLLLLFVIRAKLKSEAGDLNGALLVLQEAETRLQTDRAMQLPNILANRAQILADGGRYTQAAEQLNALDAIMPDHGHLKGTIEGAKRQIGAIRACVSARLGQSTQATNSFAAITKSMKSPDDVYARAVFCSGDTSRIADVLLAEGNQPLSLPSQILRLQPAFKSRSGADALSLATSDVRVQQFYRATQRDLPSAFVPALNRWK